MTDPTAAPLASLVPVALGFAAAATARLARQHTARAWQFGLASAALAPVLALLTFPALTPLARVMLLLITGIGLVTLHFSQRYLERDDAARRYLPWFLLTLGAASLVVVAGDLVLMGLAWTLTSLSLHRLLTYGPSRPLAEIAAHKKFLLSRVADTLVAAAVIVLIRAFGSSDIDFILAAAGAAPLPAGAALGATLLVCAVVLRSAQLPAHGWLIQVMEAPTPVSALLHAGIINLGAYLLIAFSPLLAQVGGAQLILIVVGTSSAGLAGLVMLTRNNIKATLAWSTCAQMGFVLLECGLGAYDLALLHLVAHAAYKAHAFLGAGRLMPLAPPSTSRGGVARWVWATVAAPVVVAALAIVTWGDAFQRPATLIAASILALGLVPLFATIPLPKQLRQWPRWAATLAALPLLYALWHALFASLLPVLPAAAPSIAVAIAVLSVFTALLAVQMLIVLRPTSGLLQRMYPLVASGFHLDDLFTRLTFRVWPPTLPASATPRRAVVLLGSMERAA